jgi:hypothetical protein
VILNYQSIGALEITEFAVGGLNLALLSMNFHDGRTLARRRRAARRGPARSARAAQPVVDIRA